MSKVPMRTQIATLQWIIDNVDLVGGARRDLCATLATLTMLQKYEPEVRDLLNLCIKRDEVLPGSEIRMLTPHSTAVSAIAQGRDEGGK
jgi:hypothetical protein